MQPTNDFQTLMQRWTALGPYNAIDLIRLSGSADAARWREAIVQPMIELGFSPPDSIATTYPELIAGVTAELNTPFAPEDVPLRFFLIEEESGSHYFGITFDHWIADSPSFRFLTRRAFENYEAPGSASKLPPLRVCEKPFDSLFGRASWPAAVVESVRTYLRHSRAYRIPIHDPLNLSSGFQHMRLADGLIGHIYQFAKKMDATVNDVFLAALLQTMGDYTSAARSSKPSRLFRPGRDDVAFTTAVDLRPLANESLEDQFGCLISYFSVVVKNPEKIPMPDLTRQIAAYTKSMKADRKALRFFQGFKTSLMFWDHLKNPWQRALMMHRAVPFLGGISNVNLTDTWIGRDERIVDYIRVSPTGPLIPSVFTLSTIRDRLSLCVTHRDAVFTKEQAVAIASDFARRLTSV